VFEREVVLDLEGVDRLYPNLDQPGLQTGAGRRGLVGYPFGLGGRLSWLARGIRACVSPVGGPCAAALGQGMQVLSVLRRAPRRPAIVPGR
jgi:hypothetical protein